MIQIGMTIYDYAKTSLYRVYDLLKREAQRLNVAIVTLEFNGIPPLWAALETAVCKKLQVEWRWNYAGTMQRDFR